jgi:hypothetical protein
MHACGLTVSPCMAPTYTVLRLQGRSLYPTLCLSHHTSGAERLAAHHLQGSPYYAIYWYMQAPIKHHRVVCSCGLLVRLLPECAAVEDLALCSTAADPTVDVTHCPRAAIDTPLPAGSMVQAGETPAAVACSTAAPALKPLRSEIRSLLEIAQLVRPALPQRGTDAPF